jgi:hypothetical protein
VHDDEDSVRTVPGRLDSNQETQLIQRLAMHIGARVAALAAPSEVMMSQTVKDLVAGSGLTFEDSGGTNWRASRTAGTSTG